MYIDIYSYLQIVISSLVTALTKRKIHTRKYIVKKIAISARVFTVGTAEIVATNFLNKPKTKPWWGRNGGTMWQQGGTKENLI